MNQDEFGNIRFTIHYMTRRSNRLVILLCHNTTRLAMAALLLTLQPLAQAANFGAIAFGDNGTKAGWAQSNSQQVANVTALRACNERSKNKDCQLQTTVALAQAKSKNSSGLGRGFKSVQEAQKNAINSCGEPDCKVTDVITSPGFYSLAISKNPQAGTSQIIHSHDDMASANEQAMEKCQKNSGDECTLVWSGVITGKIK